MNQQQAGSARGPQNYFDTAGKELVLSAGFDNIGLDHYPNQNSRPKHNFTSRCAPKSAVLYLSGKILLILPANSQTDFQLAVRQALPPQAASLHHPTACSPATFWLLWQEQFASCMPLTSTPTDTAVGQPGIQCRQPPHPTSNRKAVNIPAGLGMFLVDEQAHTVWADIQIL